MATGDGEVTAIPGISLSKFELVLSCNPPILESFLLHSTTTTIIQLYHTSSYLRQFLRCYPTAWKYLSFRLLQPSAIPSPHAVHIAGATRQSRNYALDQLLLHIVNPFSSCLKSLELDNTAVSGQILISTVLSLRRESLEHLSIRGCKNVSLKYHIVPWLTLFSLQLAGQGKNAVKNPGHQELALKSLYTYRCRHHRRRPYLPSSLTRKDSDSEPTHELVSLCHQLGIWTDTAWCTTPGVRCFRRRGYVSMRAPVDTKEVWVVYDRLWRSKNWVGSIEDKNDPNRFARSKSKRDGRLWEQDEDGAEGEALGVADGKTRFSDGKHLRMHTRRSHREFVERVTCDNCSSVILERCEQCSVLMHCAGCRKTLCASCAFDRPYTRNRIEESRADSKYKFWWAPGYSVSPCSMQDQDEPTIINGQVSQTPNPVSKFKWCCTEPVFSGGGGITFGPGNSARDFEKMRAAPLPKGRGWEDAEFCMTNRGTMGPGFTEERLPPARTGLKKHDHFEVMHQLLGSEKQQTPVPRNLCDDCHASKSWKVKCKACSQSLCLRHDLRGLKMRVCGYRDLASEKEALEKEALEKAALNLPQKCMEKTALSIARLRVYFPDKNLSGTAEFWSRDGNAAAHLPTGLDLDDADSTNAELGLGMRLPVTPGAGQDHFESVVASSSNQHEIDRPPRPTSPSSNATAAASRASSPAPSVDSVTLPTPTPEKMPDRQKDEIDPHPRWIGCLNFACPPFRTSADHRSRCNASFLECTDCKVNVCKSCTDRMPKACKCDGCMERAPGVAAAGAATNTPNPPANINGLVFAPHAAAGPHQGPPTMAPPRETPEGKFWCPNCRWERVRDGRCKARRQRYSGKGKGKGKAKQCPATPGDVANGSRRAARPPPAPSGIDDETAQNVAEFEDLINREDADLINEMNTFAGPVDRIPTPTPDEGASSSIIALQPLQPLTSLPSLSAIPEEAVADEQEITESLADEQDLDRISKLVENLQARIQRLRVAQAVRRQEVAAHAAGAGSSIQQHTEAVQESEAGPSLVQEQIVTVESNGEEPQAIDVDAIPDGLEVQIEGMD